MNFEIVDNDQGYLKNLFKDFIAKGSRLTQIEHLVFFPLWLYFRLLKDGFKAALHGIDTNSSKISIDRMNKNFSVVKVDKNFKYYNKDGILVKPVLNKTGTYFMSNEAELEHFVNSYKFTKAKVFSMTVDNKTCDIYKRDDLGVYIITNLPEKIDPEKYGLTLDENGNYIIPVKLSNKNIIANLKDDIHKFDNIEHNQNKPKEKSDLEKENKNINKDILDKNINEPLKENNKNIKQPNLSFVNKVLNSTKNTEKKLNKSYDKVISKEETTKTSKSEIKNKVIKGKPPIANFERSM